MAVICDLDGVVWRGERPIPGAAEAAAALRGAGHQVLFVTNNSAVPVGDVEAKLAAMGIPARGDVLSSAMAAAELFDAGQHVLAAAGAGVLEALGRRDVDVVRAPDGRAFDGVVVGLHLDFTYDRMRHAAAAIRAGARFVATNTDATYPTPDGLIPGGGAIVAAVAVAAGVEPEVAGKPHEPLAALVRARLDTPVSEAVVVGDRDDTDGLFARRLGARYALVLSGVTPPGDPEGEVRRDLVAPDLAGVARALLSGR